MPFQHILLPQPSIILDHNQGQVQFLNLQMSFGRFRWLFGLTLHSDAYVGQAL